jgi:hypothetical protein
VGQSGAEPEVPLGRRRWRRKKCGAVCVHMYQSRHTVAQPAGHCDGGHGESPMAKKRPGEIIRRRVSVVNMRSADPLHRISRR